MKANSEHNEELEEVVYDEDQGAAALKKLRERLKTCEKEKKEYLDGWQRSQADMTNVRKKHVMDMSQARQRAQAALLEKFLPVLDSFDIALQGEAWERVDDVWRKGIEHIRTQFENILQTEGIESFGEVGDDFNPTFHEALGQQEGGESHTIALVHRRGYKQDSTVIRPAQVTIFS